jgi:hypothetical protein
MRSGTAWEVLSPSLVHRADALFGDLRGLAPEGTILAGFDFPIGVPRIYAQKAGITKFASLLGGLGEGAWRDFYRVAESPDQISLTRPFYPKAPGGTNKRQLIQGLGLGSAGDLFRVCDRSTAMRAQACEIFWTLGANQVGRAAITGWRDLLAPALRDGIINIWPFDGELPTLLADRRIVVAEIYPAETYAHIGLLRLFGKRSREGRRSQAAVILSWCESNSVALSRELVFQIEDGFGDIDTGEDRFDSVVGALGLIEVVTNLQQFSTPEDPEVRNVEGWILGMRAAPQVSSVESRRAKAIKPQVEPADGRSGSGCGKWCPACGRKRFARWPSGWDAHAAHACSGVSGATAEERKRAYKELYLRQAQGRMQSQPTSD